MISKIIIRSISGLVMLGIGTQLAAATMTLSANLSGANQVPAVTSNASGRALLTIDPATRAYTLNVTVSGFTTGFTASHLHEAPVGSNGGVVNSIGASTAFTGAAGGFYAGTFTGTYGGSIGTLLSGGTYLNLHTATSPSGEIRGNFTLVPPESEKLVNTSVRGVVSPAGSVIAGFVLSQPRTVLIRSLGSSLAQFNVPNPIPDTAIELWNAAGTRIATNNNWATAQPNAVKISGFTPFAASDAAIVRWLPAGVYTAMVPNSQGSGDTLVEVYSLPMESIVSALTKAGNFTTLLAAVDAAGLVPVLVTPGSFTLFAPTDAAFAALPAGTLDSLLQPANKNTLAGILLYHLLNGQVLSTDLSEGLQAPTLQGKSATITLAGGAKVAGANITEADIRVSNGVIHVIDAVILPPAD